MKRVVYFLLISLFVTGYNGTAQAQIFKKIFGREKPKKRAPVKKKPPVKEKPLAKPVKKREVNYPASVKKTRYRVDILASLYLDELVKDNKVTFKSKLPAKALQGVELYEGVKLAADALTTFGFDIDVYVHDIQSPGNTLAALRKKGLDSSNLVIGAIQSQQIPEWATFAKSKEINFISALSPSDAEVADNPYFTLLQPTLQTHCERIMAIISSKYPAVNPLVLYRTSVPVDNSAYNYLAAANSKARHIVVNDLPVRQQLLSLLDSSATNVLVVGIIDNAYAENLLKHMNVLFPRYKFEVYGMPSWITMSSLRKVGNYPNMAIHVTTPFNYDATTPASVAISNMYKKEFGSGKPGEMVFRGYETLYWYAFLLNKYGTIFNRDVSDNAFAPFTKFEIKTKWDKQDNLQYLENQHVYLFRYYDGSFSITQ